MFQTLDYSMRAVVWLRAERQAQERIERARVLASAQHGSMEALPRPRRRSKPLSRGEFLGEMSDVLRSRAPLPLIPPSPFSHTGRRRSLGILMAETGDGIQGRAKTSTAVRRASCPHSHDEGGTPSLPGACVTPGVNSYRVQSLLYPSCSSLTNPRSFHIIHIIVSI